MNTNQEIHLHDAEVLDVRNASTQESPFTLIYNNAEGMQVEVRSAAIPVRIERLVTATVESTSAATIHDLPTVSSLKSIAKWVKLSIVNQRNRKQSPMQIDDAVVYDFRGVPPNNIGHLMLHVLPLALHARLKSKASVKFLLDAIRPPFQKLLDAFDIQPIVTEGRVHAKFIGHYAFRGLAAHRVLDLFDTAPYALMPSVFDGFDFKSTQAPKDKIFIARRGDRGLTNIDAIEAILKPLGYETLYMEDFPIEEQLAISANAKDVVAVHGASMCMLAMNPSINSLIEILPPNVYHDYFPIAYGKKIQQHIITMPYFDNRIPFNGWDKIVQFKSSPFAVDIAQLEKALSLIS